MSKPSAQAPAKRSWLAPEVIQTSEMDCGPAALKCLLEGHGVAASYGRLREACQTGVDGTSIDTLEEIAIALGLNATQTMLPPDHVLLPEASFFPCIAVIQAGLGLTHFVVAWRRVGPWIQVSDPSSGRQWIPTGRFVEMLYAHRQTLPAEAYREWANGEMNRTLQAARLRQLGATDVAIPTDGGWKPLATLDAAVRVTQRLIDVKALEAGAEAARTVRNFIDHPDAIPESAWAIVDAGDGENIVFDGAVFLHVAGLRDDGPVRDALTPELAAALSEPPARPLRELMSLMREGSVLAASLALAAILTAAAVLFQGVMLKRFAGDGSGEKPLMLVAVALVLLLQLPQAFGWLALGRRLELTFRKRFLRKIPKLGDAYFRSRPRSDMADRSHALYRLRNLPPFAGRMLRTGAELILTAAGILWLAPSAAAPVLVLLASAFALPWLMKPIVMEQDLRLRIQFGAMTRYYLDAMLGLFAIRAHGASRIIRRAHAELTDSWANTAFAYQKTLIAAEGLQLITSYAIAIWIIAVHGLHDPAQLALLAYWTLATPALAAALLQTIWQYPGHRNVTLRALEPLGALEEKASTHPLPSARAGVAIAFESVAVRVAGHTILEDVTLRIAAGEHVAIVGQSGAGKSSLAGLLLGWHKPAAGVVTLDGAAYPHGAPAALRERIAWLDPEVHLWDATCLDNIAYGSSNGQAVSEAYEEAGLQTVLSLDANVGPQGSRLSGGQGQRIRFARAWMRADARLVILDEAFRGLDSSTRARLLDKARKRWPAATMLVITHDIESVASLDRVLVVDAGRIAEEGAPLDLLANPDSKFRQLRDVEERNRKVFDGWRQLELAGGRIEEHSR